MRGDDLQPAFGAHASVVLRGRRRAAVAVVLHDAPAGLEMLFIERAERVDDPWSGHMAFPGGRVCPADADARAAAERETREEVGLELAGAEAFGRLDDLHAGIRLVAPLVLSAWVYRIPARAPLLLNHEVREALWVPIETLRDPARHVGYRWGPTRLPGVLVGEPDRHVVWGLTYQLLQAFFRVVSVPWPPVGAR